MSGQMQTVSVRISSDDLAWLSSLQAPGAVTPSDKLRSLIAQMRKQYEGALDYAACVAWLRDLLGPLVAEIRALERQHRIHSAALMAIVEWAPQIMATLLAGHGLDKRGAAEASALEDALVQQCFQLLAALMRLGVTPGADCYSPDAIDRRLPRILELAHLISANRASLKEEGIS